MLRKALFIFSLSSLVFAAKAQIKYNSPYSSIGLGDLYQGGFGANKAMGGLGVSNFNPYFLNNVNPALLPFSDYANFEFGLRYKSHAISNGEISERSADAQIDYFALGFPISPRYAMSFGLMPFSDVNYTNYVLGTTSDGSEGVIEEYKGEGGITKVYFSNGYKVFERDINTDTTRKHTILNLGLEAAYLFGSIDRDNRSRLFSGLILDESILNIQRRERYKDWRIKMGTNLRQAINIKQKELIRVNDSTSYYVRRKRFSGLYANAGFTYELDTDLNTKAVLEYQTLNAANGVITSDTISIENLNRTLPQVIGFGVSFDRTNPHGKNKKGLRRTALWTVGLDFYLSDWKPYDDNLAFKPGQGYKIIVGGEYAKDLYGRDNEKKSFWSRYIMKAGLRYEVLPYTFDGNEVTELGISFGLSSPLGPLNAKALSDQAKFVNLSFQYVQRRTENFDLEDNIWMMNLSFTLNHKWFVRKKYGL